MKSRTFKKIIEVLPMKYGETLANVKTKINLSHIPEEFTTNTNSDVLFVLLNKNTGEYLGNIKINYLEVANTIFGKKTTKHRIAYVTISELSQTVDEKAYITMINKLCFAQGNFGKFANRVQIQKNTLSERMDILIGKTNFKDVGSNYELNINNFLSFILIMLVIVACL
jgi:hypothetical protein